MALHALIFDVDGTLAETEDAHREAFNRAFAEAGLGWRWDRDLYKKLLKVTGGKERMRHYMEAYLPIHSKDRIAPEAVAPLHRRKTEIYGQIVHSGGLTLRPGVARLIREARDMGLALAIATTTDRLSIEDLFDSTMGHGALSWFSAIGAGDMVANKKPASDVYELVLEKLGYSKEHCLAIEDSRNGLDAALGAGVPTLITVSSYTGDQDFSAALAVISDLGEPGAPFRPLGGVAREPGVADIATLHAWHDQA